MADVFIFTPFRVAWLPQVSSRLSAPALSCPDFHRRRERQTALGIVGERLRVGWQVIVGFGIKVLHRSC